MWAKQKTLYQLGFIICYFVIFYLNHYVRILRFDERGTISHRETPERARTIRFLRYSGRTKKPVNYLITALVKKRKKLLSRWALITRNSVLLITMRLGLRSFEREHAPRSLASSVSVQIGWNTDRSQLHLAADFERIKCASSPMRASLVKYQ